MINQRQNLHWLFYLIVILTLIAHLRLKKDAQMQNVSQKVIKFTWNKIPVTIYLNAGTNLPTAVETLNSSPYDYFWGVWGDYTERTFYTYWTLEQGGIRYPHQWDAERNNMPYSSFTITKFQLNVPVADKDFFIPDDVRKKFRSVVLTVRLRKLRPE